MVALQHLPYLGTAEEDVLFVEWLVDAGALVKAGTPIATVETLKAAFQVEATEDGILLRQLVAAGDRVAMQAPIAVVGNAGEACDDVVVSGLIARRRPVAPESAVVPTPTMIAETRTSAASPAAPAARRRATELGVDLRHVVGTGPDGFVRVGDVEAAHARQAVPAIPCVAPGDGTLDPAFLAHVRRDATAFGALASEFKLALYRRHGAAIGADCTLGTGSVLLAERIALGERSHFGPGCIVEAKELLAGPLLHFGARCRARATRLQFGDNAFFADDIEIGGGGAMDPEAELIVGSHGFVGERVHLNPCRTLRIGDEVVVSRNAVVMTHSFGPSWLRGYPSRFVGVSVGDGAQIGIGATLFPGVEVGCGAVILSGSSVVTSVPPGRLFGGVPAVDMKAAAQPLSSDEVFVRATTLVVEFARQLQLRGLSAMCQQTDGRTSVVVVHGDGEHRLDFTKRAVATIATGVAERVVVAVEFDDHEFAAVPPSVTAIGLEPPRIRGPIGPLAAAFREFLRKRGCRLHPRTWAYTGGWL